MRPGTCYRAAPTSSRPIRPWYCFSLTRISRCTQGGTRKNGAFSLNSFGKCLSNSSHHKKAIARVFAPNCEKPPSELRTRKRLLELDRSIGRTFSGAHCVGGYIAQHRQQRLHN